MDTYFNTNHKCIACGKCVEACPRGFLALETFESYIFEGEEFTVVATLCDYVPCHHCNGFWDNNTPCMQVCESNAIEISRW